MPRPPAHAVKTKLKIVLSVLSGQSSQAEAARRHGVSETSIGKWKEQFLLGGRHGLVTGSSSAKPTGREARLEAEGDDLTRALGEAHVELRAIKRGAAASMGFRSSSSGFASSMACRRAGLPGRRAGRAHVL